MTRRNSNAGRISDRDRNSDRDDNSSSTSLRKNQTIANEIDNSSLRKTLPLIFSMRQKSMNGDQPPLSTTPPSVVRDESYSPVRSVGKDSDRRSSEPNHCNLDSERETGTSSNMESIRDKRLRVGLSELQKDFYVKQSSTVHSDEKDEIKAAFLKGTFDLTERLMHEKRNVPTSTSTSRRPSLNRRSSATIKEGLFDDLDRSSSSEISSCFLGYLTIPVNSNHPANAPLNTIDRLSATPPIRRDSSSTLSRYNAMKASLEHSASSSSSSSVSTSVSYKLPFSSDSLAISRRPLNTGPYSVSSSVSSSRTVSPEKNCFSVLSPDKNCFSLVTAQSQPILLQPLREKER
jgi:hypothetical protein